MLRNPPLVVLTGGRPVMQINYSTRPVTKLSISGGRMRLGAREDANGVPLSGTNWDSVYEAGDWGETFGRMGDDKDDFSASE